MVLALGFNVRRCALVLVLLSATGCQCLCPRVVVQPRSTVFDAPDMRAMRVSDAGVPWYAGRNDEQPGVTAGFESPVISAMRTRTYSSQWHSQGRVYDDFSRRSYEVTTHQTVH